MTPQQQAFWEEFLSDTQTDSHVGEVWHFGNSPELANKLADLVLAGKKTATASAKIQYDRHNEPLPKVVPGIFDILVDGAELPVAILETTNVYVTPFQAVTEEHARKEGEGDQTLAYWKSAHRDFWQKTFQLEEITIDIETMDVVCEEFRVVWYRSTDSLTSF